MTALARRSAVVLFALLSLLFGGVVPAPPAQAATPFIKVQGNRLLNAANQEVILRGVNRSGSEYACIQGWGIFDGPVDNASITAMKSWKINVVRVPLNENCWLGINGVATQYGGANYRAAIKGFVSRLQAQGLYVILDLHVAAPGTTKSTEIIKMADRDHAPAFWTSVANTFKSNRGVIFDLYNEPHDISWACWKNGCMVDGYQAAGMTELLAAVRNTGASNVVLLGGLQWSLDLSGWLANRPTDPKNQLAASQHSYDFASCAGTTCRNKVRAVKAKFPVVAGEMGDSDCNHDYIDSMMAFYDSIKVSYLGWTWNAGGGWTCTGGPTLITDYNGTPTGFGIGLKNRLAAL